MSSLGTQNEIFVEQVSELCAIVDRSEMKVVGVALPITYDSRGYNSCFANYTLNDYVFAKKLIAEGDIALLLSIIGENAKSREIIGVRTNVLGDGNYKVIVGYEVSSFDALPEYLPEYTETVTVPAGRYARVLINERRRADRKGYEERMHADEYFISKFREDTRYVYSPVGYGFNTYDESGEILTKYEPVKVPTSDAERFDSFRFKVVTLPDIKVACKVTPPDAEELLISGYFAVQDQVFATEAAKYYIQDYYGFPINGDQEGRISSCFGTRVSTFDGLPDCVEKITVPGGLYLHITQLEVNGDNPSMPYDVAFNHLDPLFFSCHPLYQRDWSRHVVARFRQANWASVFVPLSLRR